MMRLLPLLLSVGAAEAPAPDYAADAQALDRILVENYAYIDQLPGGVLPVSPILAADRMAVRDRDSLHRYARNRVLSLADHHIIAASPLKDGWVIFPTYADLWIERRGDAYVVDAVRPMTPAADAGIVAGDRVVAIGGVLTESGVEDFWRELGLPGTPARDGYAARLLAAGRREQPRVLTILHDGVAREVTLPSLFPDRRATPEVSVATGRKAPSTITINDALGRYATIAAFDAAMASLSPRDTVIIDLSNTPTAGLRSMARAILSWFVQKPTDYLRLSVPAEERKTGVARQWIEQVSPRVGKFHPGQVVVRVGRWTGSTGEDIAVGFRAIGAVVCGGPMSQLKGGDHNFVLPESGLSVQLPYERVMTTDGVPRETVVPGACPVY